MNLIYNEVYQLKKGKEILVFKNKTSNPNLKWITVDVIQKKGTWFSGIGPKQTLTFSIEMLNLYHITHLKTEMIQDQIQDLLK